MCFFCNWKNKMTKSWPVPKLVGLERSQFLDLPKRGACELHDGHGASLQWADTFVQSWFSYTIDFSGQNLKLRKKSRKCLRPKSCCTPLSFLPFPGGVLVWEGTQ